MKAADGTKIAEIVRYWTTCEDGIHGLDPAPQGEGNWVRYTDHLAALSAAEERERVLREALKYARFVHSMCCMLGASSQITWIDESGEISSRELPGLDSRCAACRVIDAALATPAPEQPAQPSAEKAGSNVRQE